MLSDYSDPAALWFENTACSIGDGPREIRIYPIGNCLKAEPAKGKGIADALKISLEDIQA